MAAEPQPLISERTAFLVAALYTIFYVAPFYISPTLRTSGTTSRDAPAVIRARVRAVGLTCLACTAVTLYFLTIHGHATPYESLRLLGLWPASLPDVIKVFGLVIVLFTCSLYEMIVVDGEWRDWSPSAFKEGIWDSWVGYRNLVIAPATEELVFRGLTIPLFLLAKTNPTRIVFLTPLVFGLAHLHHLYAFLQTHTPRNRRFPPAMVWLQGILLSTFQFAYTSVFGFFTAFVFLRTGNLSAVIVAHAFCNKMGVPRLWGRVGQYYDVDVHPAKGSPQGKRSDDSPVPNGNDSARDGSLEAVAVCQSNGNLGVGWTVVYYLLIPVGAYGFYKLLFPLTESQYALASF